MSFIEHYTDSDYVCGRAVTQTNEKEEERKTTKHFFSDKIKTNAQKQAPWMQINVFFVVASCRQIVQQN